jgi:hypothetical protein
MAITARNPRRTRLTVTLAGLALTLCGGILWLIGDNNNVNAENRLDQNSSAVWGRVLDYESTQEGAFAAAESDKASAETQMTIGIVLAGLGLVTIGSRWLIQAAPVTTKTPAGGNLTPKQEQQAIAMYLEAQRRQTEQ